MQPIYIRQTLSVSTLGDNSAWNRPQHKEQQILKSKVTKIGSPISTKRKEVQKRQVGEERCLEKYSSEILSLVGEGEEVAGCFDVGWYDLLVYVGWDGCCGFSHEVGNHRSGYGGECGMLMEFGASN